MEPKPGSDNKNSFFQVKIQLPETGIESLESLTVSMKDYQNLQTFLSLMQNMIPSWVT